MDLTELQKINLTSDGGIQKQVISEGIGEETPHYGCKVSVHYTGKLNNGSVFDSSVERGEPFEFNLGRGNVIKAFDVGVSTMKLGEKCNLICAPEYAYGLAGSPPKIPPNSTLLFELQMLGWKGEDISPNQDGSIERIILEPSEKRRTPNDGALVKVYIIGECEGKSFEEREVEFEYGEGNDVGILEGVELAIGRMSVGETSKIKLKSSYAFGAKGCPDLNIQPNAIVEYKIKLISCEKGIEEWTLTSEERTEQAKIYKEKGTAYFKKGNFSLALKMYKKCITILGAEDNVDSNQLKVIAYINQALCYQKGNEYFLGKKMCDEALKLDPNNIKALYRRGQCNLVINEYHAALEDFGKVINLENSNKAAKNQITICKRKIKEVNIKEKKTYANMFDKLALVNKQKDQLPEPDILSKCGEWTDEDTKREVDRAIDNNIVMI